MSYDDYITQGIWGEIGAMHLLLSAIHLYNIKMKFLFSIIFFLTLFCSYASYDFNNDLKKYERLCENGSANYCTILYHENASMHSEEKAFDLLLKSCTSKNKKNCTEVGQYLEKLGQIDKAKRFFKKGCETKDNYSCFLFFTFVVRQAQAQAPLKKSKIPEFYKEISDIQDAICTSANSDCNLVKSFVAYLKRPR